MLLVEGFLDVQAHNFVPISVDVTCSVCVLFYSTCVVFASVYVVHFFHVFDGLQSDRIFLIY